MNALKFFTIVCLLSSYVYADINLEVGILRKTALSIQKAVKVASNEAPVLVFKDDLSYIEAEIMSEKDNIVVIRFTIATRCETGAYMVRGIPHITVNIQDGVGLSSMQCDSKDETFSLIMAVSPHTNA